MGVIYMGLCEELRRRDPDTRVACDRAKMGRGYSAPGIAFSNTGGKTRWPVPGVLI